MEIKNIILLFIVLGLIGCASTPDHNEKNNTLIAQIVLKIKLGQFDEAKDLLKGLDVSSSGVVHYKVFNWENYNPARAIKIKDLMEYITNLESLYEKEVLRCSNASEKLFLPKERTALRCFHKLKRDGQFIVREYNLIKDRFVSGSFYYSRSPFKPDWYHRCQSYKAVCYPFGRIDLKINKMGPESFLAYWVNKETQRLSDQLETNRRIAEVNKRKANLEFKNSPKYLSDQICHSLSVVSFAKKIIKEENSAAKYSGVVDQARLYEAGQSIQAWSKIANRQKLEYKSKFRSPWKGKCK